MPAELFENAQGVFDDSLARHYTHTVFVIFTQTSTGWSYATQQDLTEPWAGILNEKYGFYSRTDLYLQHDIHHTTILVHIVVTLFYCIQSIRTN